MPARPPIAKATSVHAANEVRLVVPGQQHGEGSGSGGQHDRERHQLGERPAPPAEPLSPGVPERTGLQLTGQHGRADERPDQCGHRLQYEAIRQEAVRAEDGVAHAIAGSCGAAGLAAGGGRLGEDVMQLKAG